MRIAIPVTDGQLAAHFGHCEKFAFVEVDLDARQIQSSSEVEAPEHQPGYLPSWLKEQGVGLVIAGGLGARAQARFLESSIQVLTGASADTPLALVSRYLDGTLELGQNGCDH